jgi:hypothetical protein
MRKARAGDVLNNEKSFFNGVGELVFVEENTREKTVIENETLLNVHLLEVKSVVYVRVAHPTTGVVHHFVTVRYLVLFNRFFRKN